ncbi:sensor domain-containing diguanylate cyclase [Herbaspirillum lusitanum]|uniref:diguanylate cyclase n=1 Tax=Herbaspirillum lusitanum TaxID=213312 RepID=A0ABW9ADH1_9BURK
MFRSKQSSTVCLATLFVVLACVALIGLDAWRTWAAREDQLNDASIAASNMAQALAQHADDTFKEADTVLISLLEHIAEDGLDEKGRKRIRQLLTTHVGELPQLNGVFVYDAQGHWIVNSQPTLATQYNNADRAYFIYHRDHPDLEPYVGPPVQSRSTGRWIFTISRRIPTADGSFTGVVLATVDFDYFRKYYEGFDVGQQGAILFALNNGTMLVRHMMHDSTTGKSLANAAIYRDYAARMQSGTATIQSSQDGVVRINSFFHLQRYPMFVTVAVARDEVLSAWRHDAYIRTIGVLFLAGVLAAMGRLMVRRIKSQVRSEFEARSAREKSEELNVALAQLAMHDGLTGLANRRHFDRTLSVEIPRLAKINGALSLILIDVDNFKLYNDVYGHAKGDDCLKHIALAIQSCQRRPRDLAARYGGEEFALILPDCDLDSAITLAHTLRQRIADQRLPHSGSRGGFVTVSIGISSLQPVRKSDNALELIESTDQALYQAKKNGRDRIEVTSSNLKIIKTSDLVK